MPPIQNPDPIQLVSPVVMGSAAFGAFGGASHRSSTWGNALAKLLLLLLVVVCCCLLVFVGVCCCWLFVFVFVFVFACVEHLKKCKISNLLLTRFRLRF